MKLQIKDGIKNGIFPLGMMVLSMGILTGIFMSFRNLSKTNIHQVSEVTGEETSPTITRLILCILCFILSIILTIIAEIIDKKSSDNDGVDLMRNENENNSKNKNKSLMMTWILATTGGILLWQSIGECSWHFGLEVEDDDGGKSFANFPRIESLQGFPLFIILLLIFLYGYNKLGFGVESYLGSFLGNWYGHICMIGTYPIALAFGVQMEMVSWYRLSGIINFVIFGCLGLYLIFTERSKKVKYLSSISLYAAIGIIVFGVILGET